MSMEFTDNQSMGGGNSALMGLLAGSCLNKDKDDGKTTLLAAIVFVIVFIIAIIAFAMMFRDGRRDYKDGNGTDIAAMLTPLIAAKSMDGNGCIDKFEIMQKIEHSEDRARETQTQQEICALGKEFANIGFGLASKIDNVEKEQLKTYSVIQNQLGMQSEALKQLLTVQNNSAIINGVIQQLTMGAPCFGKC